MSDGRESERDNRLEGVRKLFKQEGEVVIEVGDWSTCKETHI